MANLKDCPGMQPKDGETFYHLHDCEKITDVIWSEMNKSDKVLQYGLRILPVLLDKDEEGRQWLLKRLKGHVEEVKEYFNRRCPKSGLRYTGHYTKTTVLKCKIDGQEIQYTVSIDARGIITHRKVTELASKDKECATT